VYQPLELSGRPGHAHDRLPQFVDVITC
jgi:hypothetical protein